MRISLKLLRRKRGLTQKELAKRLRVTQQYISKLENGNIDGLTIGKLKKLAKVLGIDVIEMLRILLERNK